METTINSFHHLSQVHTCLSYSHYIINTTSHKILNVVPCFNLRNYPMKNVRNGISESPKIKISWGQAPRPPQWLVHSALDSFCRLWCMVKSACEPSGKNFRTAPYTYYACRLINYACTSLSCETMANTLRYWIYTLIIITYCANKRGFRWARFFFLFFSLSLLHSSFFFLPLYATFLYPAFPRLLFLFPFSPRQASNLYPSITPGLQVQHLYHYATRFSWKMPVDKLILFVRQSWKQKKIYITIYLFIHLFEAYFWFHESMHHIC